MILRLASAFAALTIFAAPAAAQTTPLQTDTVPIAAPTATAVTPAGPLRVGVAERPPYAMEDDTVGWTGIGVDLWRLIAEREGLDYAFVAVETPADALAANAVDIALPLAATEEAAGRVALTQPFDTPELALAQRAEFRFMSAVEPFLSWRFARIVAGISAVLLLVGALMWLIERRANAEQFGTVDDEDGERPGLARRTLRGLGSGFWWSGVTMTTIGYGDKAPVTLPGRTVAMLWMLVSMALTASLTAAVVNTSSASGGGVSLAEAVSSQSLGAVDPVAAAYLDGEGTDFETYDGVDAGLAALKDGEVDGLVAPETLLRHAAGNDGAITLTRSREAAALFAIGGADAERIEAIDAALLAITQDPAWTALVKRYAPD